MAKKFWCIKQHFSLKKFAFEELLQNFYVIKDQKIQHLLVKNCRKLNSNRKYKYKTS